jgi:hypothetical protein
VNDVRARFAERHGESQVNQYHPGQDVAVEVSLSGS